MPNQHNTKDRRYIVAVRVSSDELAQVKTNAKLTKETVPDFARRRLLIPAPWIPAPGIEDKDRES